MFSRLAHLFTSFLTGHFESFIQASIVNIAQDVMKKGRKTLLVVMSSFVFSVLLTAGVVIAIYEASSQYDTKGIIYFSAMLTSSLILSLVSLGVLVAIFWPRENHTQISLNNHSTAGVGLGHNSAKEDIIALVIAEGLQFLRNRNEKAKAKDYYQG